MTLYQIHQRRAKDVKDSTVKIDIYIEYLIVALLCALYMI